MMETHEFLVRVRLDADVIEEWIEAGWLRPRRQAGDRRFSEIDLARAQLIQDLKEDLGVNDEGVAVILDLVDQVHGLRRTLREILSSIHAQPEDMRRRIVADILQAAPSRASGRLGRRRTRTSDDGSSL